MNTLRDLLQLTPERPRLTPGDRACVYIALAVWAAVYAFALLGAGMTFID